MFLERTHHCRCTPHRFVLAALNDGGPPVVTGTWRRGAIVVPVKRSYWRFFEWPALVPGDSAAC
jgi:hypothetical protein